jgi:hypothetical protein
MTWKQKTWHEGGGGDIVTDIRHFRYRFNHSFFNKFKGAYEVTLTFEDHRFYPRGLEDKQYRALHKKFLSEAPFTIAGRNVIEWAKECITSDWAVFDFKINKSISQGFVPDPSSPGELMIPKTNTLRARFGNKGHAALFKLALGGKMVD